MKNFGFLIKSQRIKQNMRQKLLADGICSTFYLSKIEHGTTVPSEEVRDALLDRLNLSLDQLTDDSEETFIEKLHAIYKDAVLYRNRPLVNTQLDMLLSKNYSFENTNNFYMYNLYIFRLYLISERPLAELSHMLSAFDTMMEKLDPRQQFIFFLNRGLFHYLNYDYKMALESLEPLLSSLENTPIENWELADYLNILSLTYFYHHQNLQTIEYAMKAIHIFDRLQLNARIVDSYLLIGLAHKRNASYQKAEEVFKLSRKLSKQWKLEKNEAVITQNLGSLYSVQGKTSKAIKYYKMSYRHKTEPSDILFTVYSIVKEYLKTTNVEAIIEWCQIGHNLIEQYHPPNAQIYIHHFSAYQMKCGIIPFDDKALIAAIKYFENIQDYRHVHKYSILLSELYFQANKYKNAGLYFQKANEYLYKMKKIGTWEDL